MRTFFGPVDKAPSQNLLSRAIMRRGLSACFSAQAPSWRLYIDTIDSSIFAILMRWKLNNLMEAQQRGWMRPFSVQNRLEMPFRPGHNDVLNLLPTIQFCPDRLAVDSGLQLRKKIAQILCRWTSSSRNSDREVALKELLIAQFKFCPFQSLSRRKTSRRLG